MFFKVITIALFVSLFGLSGSHGEEGRWEEPWQKEERQGRAPSAGERVAENLIRFFINYISPVDGDRCPSYPTCSQYGLEAVRKHGVLAGFVMTCDRLIHESDEIRGAPLIKVHDSYRYYDPVENNDFWWDKRTGNR